MRLTFPDLKSDFLAPSFGDFAPASQPYYTLAFIPACLLCLRVALECPLPPLVTKFYIYVSQVTW